MKPPFKTLVCIVPLLALSRPAAAADTIEAYDPGTVTLESYLAFDGVNQPRGARTLGAELLLAVGVVERFSAYFVGALQDAGGERAGRAGLGFLGTPLDTTRLDLDLWLDLCYLRNGDTGLAVNPGAELNLAVVPKRFGLYLQAKLPYHGFMPEHGDPRLQVELTGGAHVDLGERHQLLLQYGGDLMARPRDAGTVATGYNLVLLDGVELIAEVGLALPDAERGAGLRLMAGAILTQGL